MKGNITFVSPPHERPASESISPVPTNEQEFYRIVNDAPWEELKAYGFRKWETMNNIIRENIAHKDDANMISMPVYGDGSVEGAAKAISDVAEGKDPKPSESILFDLGTQEDRPMELLEHDEDIILFPGEWYNIIPNGFKATSLWGDTKIFKRGKSDNDVRFGCLAYGIRRLIELPPTPQEQFEKI